jgi:hypothetical protein
MVDECSRLRYSVEVLRRCAGAATEVCGNGWEGLGGTKMLSEV